MNQALKANEADIDSQNFDMFVKSLTKEDVRPIVENLGLFEALLKTLKNKCMVNELNFSLLTDIPVRTLQSMRTDKIGPPYTKIGRNVRYNLKKCELYFDENTVES